MSFYHKLGKIPKFRHTTFYKPDGESLYWEELVSAKGFSSIYSNKYHINSPTKTLSINELANEKNVEWKDAPLMHFHFMTDKKNTSGNFLTSRDLFLTNPHCNIYTARVNENADIFYRNSYAHEYIFVHHGKGTFLSDYGNFGFVEGDQIIVPIGTIYRMEFDSFDNNKLLIIESDTCFDIPSHYRNEYGQLLEDAPYCERDIKVPAELDPIDEKSEYTLILKAGKKFFEYKVPHHPFDVVGWDGHLYPFAFNIKDFASKVGKIHLPPPVHLLFTTEHFVVCNFCPRLFDFHPESIPAPYFHHNLDSAEVLYYVEGDFMSREGVGPGSITLHPMGIPHGPQPGKIEASIGVKSTEEYAVMIDTFGPLFPTENVRETMDPDYYKSWLTE